ncbi:DUF6873 family GME fold protein [Clostridium pasteurianum]|uniref:DUF6873 domain-containing protein n=1 Tax=Clostridium pasteurianum BC1 TaxID=86416 RepID=R4K450_CLOPA|nr:hypothetical protein [Clostridium pasteurianum]AGK97917.1 hypothetical protein Clopa_3097 [Clostridium pasteurianum BC1]
MKNVLVDFRISETEKENLYKNGFEPIIVPPSKSLYNAICGHPDMLLHIIDKKNIVVHNTMEMSFIYILKNLNYNVIKSHNSLKETYPYDIFLNAISTNDIFLHNLKYTDKNLISMVKGKKLLNVKQGYSKCSTALINDSAAITSDIKIHDILTSNGVKVLLVPPGNIELPGLNYGFIGGTCGIVEDGSIAFFGNLDNYLYGDMVFKFLIQQDVKPIFLSKGNLIDRGTLFRI